MVGLNKYIGLLVDVCQLQQLQQTPSLMPYWINLLNNCIKVLKMRGREHVKMKEKKNYICMNGHIWMFVFFLIKPSLLGLHSLFCWIKTLGKTQTLMRECLHDFVETRSFQV